MAADIQIKKRFTRRRLIVILILSVAVIAAGWLFYLGLSLTFLGGAFGLKPPLWLKESRYNEVVRDIEAGKLVPSKANAGPFSLTDYAEFAVALPPSQRNLAPLGIAFAEKRSDGRLFAAVSRFYSLNGDKKNVEGLWKAAKVWQATLSKKVVPIADDGGGNQILLYYSGKSPSVKLCLHDSDFKIIHVADSFSEFLDMLHEDPNMI